MERYHPGAIAFHWIAAALILANLVLGISMVQLPISPRKLNWYLWHKSIGVTIFAVTALRLAWRAMHPAPAAVPMPAWQQRAAGLSHVALYALMVLVPLSGWLFSSASGVQVVYARLLPLPDLVPRDRALADVLRVVHLALNASLATIVVVHIAAALKHHFVDRDGVLARMVPFLAPRMPSP